MPSVLLLLLPATHALLLPPLSTRHLSPSPSPSRGGLPSLRLPPKRVVIVGGGWAGYSAAESLSASADCHVTLLDASARSAGGLAGGWRTAGGRPVEAGLHGFWREYRNTFALLRSIGLPFEQIFTPYTPSVLVAKTGRVATAPVLAVEARSPAAAWLPAPLETALLAQFASSSRLSLADRASAIGLLGCWADFGQEDPASWARYDNITAEELFKRFGGVTDALYTDMVEPLLHVLPMGPGYDISAAAALSCFHVFALQSRGAFDVRWCRGSIAEAIFKPWQARLQARPNVHLEAGARVSSVSFASDGGGLQVAVEGRAAALPADAVLVAVGATAAAPLGRASPALRGLRGMRGVTCVAARLFLRPAAAPTRGLRGGAHEATLLPREAAEAMAAAPVVVAGPGVGGIPQLEETGFCVYDLQRLHDEHARGQLGVLEVDFYRADAIADIDDDAEVAALALRAAAAALGVAPRVLHPSLLVDVAVVRARRAVSHFAPGSAALSPGVKLGGGVYACGDWIDRTGHASWSTEKAVVTGRQAAAAIAEDFGLRGVQADVIPAAEDTPPLQALRQVASALRATAPAPLLVNGLPPPAPWALLRSLLAR
ncbi:hypothetical protein AB1Y20_016219 [Prymnesium parvum]|uniref:Amine oxidase domain-containing protein n=1 Tax=Prymnesium parvum TaxID=97485 RepID=A0AB34IC71_PRYPA